MSIQLLADLSEIPRQLGIEWPKLIAQAITFMVVYWVLSKYAFGPVNQILEQRRQRIAEGEENLKKIRTDLEAANSTAADIRAKAEEEAKRIIKEAQDAANATKEVRTQEAISEAANIVAKAREASQLERDRTFADLKNEFARLVVNTTSKVTGKVLAPEDHERINQEALTQISK